jgi:transposase-like protein
MSERYNPGREPEESCPPRGAARRQKSPAVVRRSYPAEFRLTAVRLRLEEGVPFELIARNWGFPTARWPIGLATIASTARRRW